MPTRRWRAQSPFSYVSSATLASPPSFSLMYSPACSPMIRPPTCCCMSIMPSWFLSALPYVIHLIPLARACSATLSKTAGSSATATIAPTSWLIQVLIVLT